MHEPESWKPWNGRLYNTYRSQPRNYDVAPDLVPTGIQVFSPNVACGTLSNEIQITVLVKNAGDLRVGPGVVLQFFGIWDNAADPIPLVDSTGAAITTTVTKSLEPGSSTLTAAVSYQGGNGSQVGLPKEVRVMVDAMIRAGSAEPARFLPALAATRDYKGVAGTITFDRNGDVVNGGVSLFGFKDRKRDLIATVP